MGLLFSRHQKTNLPGSQNEKSNAQSKTTTEENTSTAQQQSTPTTNAEPSQKKETSSPKQTNTNVDNTNNTQTTPPTITVTTETAIQSSETKSESPKQAEPTNNNNNNNSSDPPVISIWSEWKLGPDDRQSMKTQFVKLDTDQDGFILMEEMNIAFGEYGVDDETLRKIWNLVDIKQLERLDCIGYIICRVLIRNVKEGNALPDSLPESFMLAARGDDPNDSDQRRRSSGLSPQEEAELGALRHTRVRRGAFYQDKSPVTSPPPKLNSAPPGTLPSNSSSGQTKVSKKAKSLQGKIRCNSAFCHVGYADTIGQRASMEDEIVIYGHFRGKEDEDFIAVFDGHGGADSAEFMSKCLHNVLEDQLKENAQNPAECLKASFLKANEALRTAQLRGGATGLVAFIQDSQLYIANIGDCRAVLCVGGQPVRVTEDHKASLASEEQRIVKLGGFITTAIDRFGNVISRVCGQLAVTRAFGDFSLEPFVIAEPDVFGPYNLDVKEKVFFLIMACDGVWDKVSDEEAVSIVAPISDPEKAAIKLRDWAYLKGSDDNISVVVVRFPPFLK
mmetsp:Transcript_25184/g.35282  ORF Transcript_25184/g.35282 Transcript_25184/m.35282 type:complete len:561 (-) Transcript_25184:439-2121(-)|eukprot:CAMPEP_0168540940 /NCGR_PEP_ID=MMETSP0413-20121227/548_1 /TAXON_ID=136452 /ORGANISM="Filamoeba nolandi, Strain NC-AS-23-1" /LENGTH=560 /DNA_ID=CAMNT_0008570715 /DNA_START=138 /DNA_END=1820 /DNA_ORIENTATION=-